MNNKTFLSAAISTFFAFTLTAGIVTFSPNRSFKSTTNNAHSHTKTKVILPQSQAYYQEETDFAALFANEVEINRDEFIANLSSVNRTSVSKTAELSFSSTRLIGFGTNQQNLYGIIDDENYSGDTTSASLDPNITNPVFDGYTAYAVPTTRTAVIKEYDNTTGIETTYSKFIVPDTLDHAAGSFKVTNKVIKKGTFSFPSYDEAEYQALTPTERKKKYNNWPEYIVIGTAVETIEKGAFDNVPSFMTIQCIADSQPSGWDSEWLTHSNWSTSEERNEHILFGYELIKIGNGTHDYKNTDEGSFLTAQIGGYTKTFGKLEKPMFAGTSYVAVADVNWSGKGDYENPVKYSSGSAPYTLDSIVVNTILNDADIYVPEIVSYINVIGDIVNIGKNGISFPDSDFVNHLYYCVDDNCYVDSENDKTTNHQDHNLVKLTKKLSYICLEGYIPTGYTTPIYNLTADQKADAIGKGLTVVDTYRNEYVGNVERIHIPSKFTYMPKDAVTNVPDSVQILCENTEKPASWNDSWTDGKNIIWGQEFPNDKRNLAASNANEEFYLEDSATTFIAGYKYDETDRKTKHYCTTCQKYIDEGEVENHEHPLEEIPDVTPLANKPLVVEYQVVNSNNETITVYQEMPLKSEEETSQSNSHYDAVTDLSESREFDILIEDGELFLPDSVVVHNLFRAKTERIIAKVPSGNQVVTRSTTYTTVDEKVAFCAKVLKRYKTEVDISDVIETKFGGLSQFGRYNMITLKIDKKMKELPEFGYKKKPSYWFEHIDINTKNQNMPHILDGSYTIRYVISSLNNSYYRVKYNANDGGLTVLKSALIPVVTPNPIYVIEKNYNNQLSFLFKNNDVGKDFKLSNIVSFELIGLQLNVHAWNVKGAARVSKTELKPRFGALMIKEATDSGSIFFIPLFIAIFTLIATAIYWLGTIVCFLYSKNKFKNDEFRRVRPRAFFKNAMAGYIGFTIVLLFLLFTAERFGRFRNGISVHNPLDVFVIIPGILSIIMVGYFIKFTAGKIKIGKERRRAIKLKLNEDVADDGTN